MRRRKDLLLWSLTAFGLGLVVGQWGGSLFWCGGGGVLLMLVGIILLRSR